MSWLLRGILFRATAIAALLLAGPLALAGPACTASNPMPEACVVAGEGDQACETVAERIVGGIPPAAVWSFPETSPVGNVQRLVAAPRQTGTPRTRLAEVPNRVPAYVLLRRYLS